MANIDPVHNRKVAAWLADALTPLIPDMPVEPPPPHVITRKVVVGDNAGIVRQALKVAAAVDGLDQARFTKGERGARLALERAAKLLRTEVRRRSRKSQP